MKKSILDALKFYTKALRAQPGSPIIYLNRSAAFLAMERYFDAYQEAKHALEQGGDKEKALFRLGKASYGMQDYQKSSQHFLDLIKQFPNSTHAKEELQKALSRLKESRIGSYDMSTLYHEFHDKNVQEFDLAEYKGPVEVKSLPGKGKGVVATRDIEPGTILLVSKAFSTAYPIGLEHRFYVVDINSDYIISQTQIRHMIDTMEMLKKNPHKAKELYAKYSGEEDSRDGGDVPDGIIDAGRIEKICIYNHDVLYGEKKDENEDDPIGLWLLPSYMNHSCLGNAYRTSYGNIKIVYAISHIKPGEEITFNYINPDRCMDLQERIRVQVDGDFQCQCHLCSLDRSDRFLMQREKLCEQFNTILYQHGATNPDLAAKMIDSILEKLRQSYKTRHELQAQLFLPLYETARLYFGLENYEKCIELFKELEIKMIEFNSFKVSNVGIDALLLMSKCYTLLKNQDLAKIYEEKAYRVNKIRCGSDAKLFKEMFVS